MVYIYFDVWFPIIMVFFIVVLVLVLLRVRRARQLRMASATVITDGESKSLNTNHGMIIAGGISDSGNHFRLLDYRNLITAPLSARNPSRHLHWAPLLIIALIYKSFMFSCHQSNRTLLAFSAICILPTFDVKTQ